MPTPAGDTHDGEPSRPIGALIQQTLQLSDEQLESIAAYQREHGVRFGEAALALGLATSDDVMWALSQQYHYAHDAGRGATAAELVVSANPFGEEAERFRELRSQLLMGVMSPEHQPRRALAVLSPDRGDGKTYVAANLAVALSQLGENTLLIDADMRTPRQHRVFGLEGSDTMLGLSALLSGRTSENAIQPVRNLPNLYLLPVGGVPPNPLELVQRAAFALLIKELLTKFDHVVVDTPAAEHGADARVIAARCGAALLIGRKNRSRMESLNALINALEQGPAKIGGVVINER